jgi:hypothetical protein
VLAEHLQNGVIVYSPEIIGDVDRVFDKFEQEKLRPITEDIAKQTVKTIEKITDYFKIAGAKAAMDKLAKAQEERIYKKLGIRRTPRGFKLVRGGYLDKTIGIQRLRQEVTKEIVKTTSSQPQLSQVMKAVENLVEPKAKVEKGTGAVEKHVQTMVVDTINSTVREQMNEQAKVYGMQAALYSGTVIAESRCFCEMHTGKVILISEALNQWPELLNDECGPKFSKNMVYSALNDLGGHNCRHMLRYISNFLAMRKDATIKQDKDGNLYRVAA